MVHVKVLQHHIDQGQAMDASSCAVALAVREQFPEAKDISVSGVILKNKGRSAQIIVDDNIWVTVPGVWEWIHRFDNYEDVEPIEFDLLPC